MLKLIKFDLPLALIYTTEYFENNVFQDPISILHKLEKTSSVMLFRFLSDHSH